MGMVDMQHRVTSADAGGGFANTQLQSAPD